LNKKAGIFEKIAKILYCKTKTKKYRKEWTRVKKFQKKREISKKEKI